MKPEKNKENDLPILEIKPSEEYHPRPMWQRVGAWILTGIFALWGKIV